LDIKNSPTEPTHLSIEGEIKSKRKHTLNNLLAGSICDSCNNGWMSSLEQESQRILKPRISGSLTLEDITLEERFILARWAFKTAICMNYSSNFYEMVPAKHFRFIYESQNTLPGRVFVCARTHKKTSDFSWFQTATWNFRGNQPDPYIQNILTTKGYKIGFQFGNLLLLISYLPIGGLAYILRRNYHLPLWPQKGRIALINEIPEIQETSTDELIRFLITLDVTRNVK
jgi:hypothetical protein